MRLEIYSTRLASQQHQHEAVNLQHEARITTTSTQSWKYLALACNHNNINMKLEIFSTRMASTLLHLWREVLSDYTKIILKVIKLYMR
jgi:hypothetical protein